MRVATSPRAKEEAQRQLGNAQRKASRHAIDRSVFACCVFELEDKVLGVIDEYFQQHGWTVPTLIFDGMHVNHRDEADLDAAMRGAEAAVLTELGYKISLLDKPLYNARKEEQRQQENLKRQREEEKRKQENHWPKPPRFQNH